jgi:hypothetical protein
MRTIFPPFKSKPKFQLDFSLAYVGVFLLTFSILGTELFKQYPAKKIEVLQVRTLHTLVLLSFLFIMQSILKRLKMERVGYPGLVVIGLSIAIPSLFVRVFLMNSFGLLNKSEFSEFVLSQLIINLTQAFFWIPVVIVLGGQRSKIFQEFKNYEQRLIINARKNIRESNTFINMKKQINQGFKEELIRQSNLLLLSLNSVQKQSTTLKEKNEILQRYLKTNSLREFSRNLQQQTEVLTESSELKQNLRSVNLISKQFNILFNFVARKSPLPAWVFTLLSFSLILPNYIHFFTLQEVLELAPLLFILIHMVALQINRILHNGGKYAILQTNLLTLLIGLLPLIENFIFNKFYPDPNIRLPLFITGFFYPIGYFVFIRFIQIVQPDAIAAISGDAIYASPALKGLILKIVNDEFEQSIAHQWATYTHGKILTRLAATSLKLEQSANNDDAESFELGLENLKFILEDPTREFEQVALDVKGEISSRIVPWEGLISIKLKIDSTIEAISNERVRDLGDVIEEIISNSVRHGGSQNIHINVTLLDHPDIQIFVEDDATNPLPLVPSRVGLGTKIFNLASDGRWSISHADAKTSFKLTMSLLEKR